MIPKVIHYCRFGGGPKGKLFEKCRNSWDKYCPDRTIKERNESHIDIQNHVFMTKAYQEKKRAFVSDVARLQVLYNKGGVYLDTDMELIKPIDHLLSNTCFLGREDDARISGGIIGAIPGHNYIKTCLDTYKKQGQYIEIPKVLSSTYENFDTKEDITIYTSEIFYPFPARTRFDPEMITDQSLGIHRWEDSWNTSQAKILKTRVPKKAIVLCGKILDFLRLKNLLKKILNI